MDTFKLGDDIWRIQYVDYNDPILVDRTGKATVAVTDLETMTVYISDQISGEFLTKVLIHEIGHCIIFSFRLLDDIHQMVHPRYWVEAEEWLCDFVADYGVYILQTLKLIGR